MHINSFLADASLLRVFRSSLDQIHFFQYSSVLSTIRDVSSTYDFSFTVYDFQGWFSPLFFDFDGFVYVLFQAGLFSK